VSGESVEEQLYRTRKRLQMEMRRALACVSPSAKRKLAARWREEYSELMYQELLGCARHKEVCRDIANWNLDEFDKGRKK
jgi:hypothetical protein